MNKGDVVIIKRNLKPGVWYGPEVFVKDMSEFRGKPVTVSKVKGRVFYIVEDGELWSWTRQMIERSI